MSLTPAQDEIEARKKREALELCGKNRGPHDYMPIEFLKAGNYERVTRMLCRVCFSHITTKDILDNYPEINL